MNRERRSAEPVALRVSLQHRIERGEHLCEMRAEAVDDDDDGERNTGGDQRVLDRGSARLILPEFPKRPLHVTFLPRLRAFHPDGGNMKGKACELMNP